MALAHGPTGRVLAIAEARLRSTVAGRGWEEGIARCRWIGEAAKRGMDHEGPMWGVSHPSWARRPR